MVVTERDKIVAKTLIEVLNKASYKLEGVEVIVTGRVMEWAAQLQKRIEEDLKPKDLLPVSEPAKVEIKEEPKKKSRKKKAS